MWGGVDGVVHRGAMADVGVGDQAHIEQDVEGSVDGGCVDAWQLRSDLVGGRVAQALHRLPHVAALVGAPVAAVAQPGFETVVHTRWSLAARWLVKGSPTAPHVERPCQVAVGYQAVETLAPMYSLALSVRMTVSVVISRLARVMRASWMSAMVTRPCHTSAKPVGWLKRASNWLSGRGGRMLPPWRRADLVAPVVEDPRPGVHRDERTPVAGEREFLAEAEVFDRGVMAGADADPLAQ